LPFEILVLVLFNIPKVMKKFEMNKSSQKSIYSDMDFLLNESQLEVILENVTNSHVFKTEYNPGNKTILASYYVLEETDKVYKVLNPMEFEQSTVWGDSKAVYKIKMPVVTLSKTQVTKLGPEAGFKGYYKFEIPYWVYKKEPNMVIKKINKPKRFTSPNDSEFIRSFTNSDYREAFEVIGTDMRKWTGMSNILEKWLEIERQKKAGTYVEPEKPNSNPSQGFGFMGDSNWTGD
jgi:hypothetical protein